MRCSIPATAYYIQTLSVLLEQEAPAEYSYPGWGVKGALDIISGEVGMTSEQFLALPGIQVRRTETTRGLEDSVICVDLDAYLGALVTSGVFTREEADMILAKATLAMAGG